MAVAYAIVIGVLVYRELRRSQLPRLLYVTGLLSAKVIVPGKSKGSFLIDEPLKLSGGSKYRATPKPTNASTADRYKFERHPKAWVSNPPSTGPNV